MSVTRVDYPKEENIDIAVFCQKGSVILKSLDIWQMKGIWKQS